MIKESIMGVRGNRNICPNDPQLHRSRQGNFLTVKLPILSNRNFGCLKEPSH